MLQNFKKLLKFFSVVCAFLAIPWATYAEGQNALIVSYATAHLNYLSDVVQGVLIAPSGDIFTTEAMGSFGNQKIVIDNPEEGSYSAYFQALIEIRPKYCYVVGGIDAHLCCQPSLLIPFTPTDSHIQGFTQFKAIKIGDTTLPIASFYLN